MNKSCLAASIAVAMAPTGLPRAPTCLHEADATTTTPIGVVLQGRSREEVYERLFSVRCVVVPELQEVLREAAVEEQVR